uniref:Uncharacterized protein n=1 Tax=Craspedostauros australis TaxID=1486917 RepID=A0A7R9WZE2_9STRA
MKQLASNDGQKMCQVRRLSECVCVEGRVSSRLLYSLESFLLWSALFKSTPPSCLARSLLLLLLLRATTKNETVENLLDWPLFVAFRCSSLAFSLLLVSARYEHNTQRLLDVAWAADCNEYSCDAVNADNSR